MPPTNVTLVLKRKVAVPEQTVPRQFARKYNGLDCSILAILGGLKDFLLVSSRLARAAR